MNRDQQKALSLVELLVVVILLAVFLAIATPSFSSYLQRTQQTTHLDEMLAALHFSRSEAVSRRVTVSLCDGIEDCGTRRWKTQLIVFTDANQNGRFDADEVLLRTLQIAPPYSWNWSNFRSQNHISFKSNGMTYSLNGTFTLCREATAVRSIVINVAGRTRLDTPSGDSNCK
ncbi:GspH/FimT family pseudopilin [Phytopseudomonas dryadis]|uniref:Type II secretion system protein H n=1 Tax=Phytopseudomonas dryadis TaxID=2487520 RepID=A0A4Q9R394_9GAMM|nr:GspH/FimT family pseudopilin [Pseudomonas dryadis]TBU92957.1 pilus assembly protein [Pseudomonas dryadis]